MIRLLTLLLFSSVLAHAYLESLVGNGNRGFQDRCYSYHDCRVSEKCEKTWHSIYGICVTIPRGFLDEKSCLLDSQCPAHQICIKPRPSTSGKCVPQGLPPGNKLTPRNMIPPGLCHGNADCPSPSHCEKRRGFEFGVCTPSPSRMLLDDKCTVTSECNAGEKCLRLPGNVRGICVPADKFRRFQQDDPIIMMPGEDYY